MRAGQEDCRLESGSGKASWNWGSGVLQGEVGRAGQRWGGWSAAVRTWGESGDFSTSTQQGRQQEALPGRLLSEQGSDPGSVEFQGDPLMEG